MNMLSMISPASSGTLGFKTTVRPSRVTSSMRTSRALSSVIDFSP